jgi:guanyl-specific ribonuclease Sa
LRTLIRLNRLRSSIPDAAKRVAEYAKRKNGAVQPGYKGGRIFENDGRGGQTLPTKDGSENIVTYREYDVNPYVPGQNRGSERVVIGDNGKAYYTKDHYSTFKEIKMK